MYVYAICTTYEWLHNVWPNKWRQMRSNFITLVITHSRCPRTFTRSAALSRAHFVSLSFGLSLSLSAAYLCFSAVCFDLSLMHITSISTRITGRNWNRISSCRSRRRGRHSKCRCSALAALLACFFLVFFFRFLPPPPRTAGETIGQFRRVLLHLHLSLALLYGMSAAFWSGGEIGGASTHMEMGKTLLCVESLMMMLLLLF